MTIWKLPLEVTDEQEVSMPRDAQLLCVQTQRGMPCLWALVDAGKPAVKRSLLTVGTGHSAPSDIGAYVGTYQLELQGGMLVFHVFERKS
jgi:hypothetical protein